MSISTLASLGMAIGAPLVYADQAYSIYRKQDARGFSHDVCAVLLIANITRCFFWLGERFEFALLLQSLLMIAAQLGLLNLCIRFKPVGRWSKSISSDGARVVFNADENEEERNGGREREEERDLMDLNTAADQNNQENHEEEAGYADKQPLLVTLGSLFRANSSYGQVSSTDSHSSILPEPSTTTSHPTTSSQSRLRSILTTLTPTNSRPLNFWQWSDYNSYLIFLFLFILFLSLFYLLFSSCSTFIALLGYFALGLESTLPIPQLISNYRRKSLAGFRASVLLGWLGGDSFKLLYFLFKGSPAQFTSCAIFQLSVDLAILAQKRLYKEKTEQEEEEMRKKAEAKQAGRSSAGGGGVREGEVEEDIEDELPARNAGSKKKSLGKGKGKSNSKSVAREDDGLLEDPHHVISIEADQDDDEGDISNSRRK